jgi:phosphoglycolate phosphatase
MKLVMFDMDGTLIDTQGLIAEHMANAFTKVGLAPPSPAESRRIIGLSLPIAMGRLAGSDDPQLIETLVAEYKDHYRASLLVDATREPLFPGAREALERLSAQDDLLLGIATGKGLTGVERILATLEITDLFVTFQTPDHSPSKPNPGMLLRAMAETGCRPEEVVMVGDTTFDMEMARNARTHALGVTWGYHERDELLSAGANRLIDSYDDIDSAITALLEPAHA